MDPRISLSPSSYGFNHEHDRHYHPSEQTSPHTMPELPFSSHSPLPIMSRSDMNAAMNTAMNTAPPPLPPPSRIRELEDGYDAGWLHANSERSVSALPPINPNSSLYGGHQPPESTPHSDRMELDEFQGRQSKVPHSRSSEIQLKVQPPRPTDKAFSNSMSINSAGPILKGERHFSIRSVKDSSNAYDQHLLSKIGNSLSSRGSMGHSRRESISDSPRGSISHGSDSRGSISALAVPSRTPSNLPYPGASEGSTLDAKRHSSPQSGVVSPRTKLRWREYFGGRSPSVESNAPPSATYHDSSFTGEMGRRRRRGSTSPREDNTGLPSRPHRGNSDQAVFSDKGDLPTDEPIPSRHFVLREPTPPYANGSRQGMKRRASSPPEEPMTDDRDTLHMATSNGDLSQRRTNGHPSTDNPSVNGGYAPSERTLPAALALSIRISGSYSSTLPTGDSSITSLSPYDRPSPGGLTPNSNRDTYHEKSILNPSSTAAHVQPRGLSGANGLESPTADATGKVSMPKALGVPKPPAPKVNGLFICNCCPKKPKKFNNPEDLRAHEMEKQYACQYCNNRFKNKNEAERHQNSLHLRRHSWSCAALPSFQAAFQGSVSPACQTSAGPSHDTCGYCGEEFPNFPRPDWDRRFEHLTTVHKYGECNNTKKFYRADHFRQHFKHSHAGTSGKWTSILENACMRDELSPEPRDRSTTSAAGPAAGSPANSVSLLSNTIGEVLEQ